MEVRRTMLIQPASRSWFRLLAPVLALGLIVACAPAEAPEAAGEQVAEPSGPAREYYEIRRYRLADEESRQTVLAYLENALVPALNRAGIDRVGVFGVEPPSAEGGPRSRGRDVRVGDHRVSRH